MSERDNESRGAFFVGARRPATDAPATQGSVIRVCHRCRHEVLIEPRDVDLAESCTDVMCADCTGTSVGILYIAP